MDCSRTETFLCEWKRMCKANKCNTCCLHSVYGTCKNFIITNPEKAVEIVQEWSDQHPVRTRLSVLKEHFPNAQMKDNGTPLACVTVLYGASSCFYDADGNIDCVKCWNTPIEGVQ